MKSATYLLWLLLVITACVKQVEHKTAEASSNNDSSYLHSTTETKQQHPIISRINGAKELKYSEAADTLSNDFPNCKYASVKVYELNGHENHSGAESVFTQRTGESKVLTESQVAKFLTLINDKNSFYRSTAACHEPRLGLVFYNTDNEPCSYLSLCLACNNIYSKPMIHEDLAGGIERGFSIASRKQIREIFVQWGFPDLKFSWLYDDEKDLRKILTAKGMDSLEVEQEVALFLKEKAAVE